MPTHATHTAITRRGAGFPGVSPRGSARSRRTRHLLFALALSLLFAPAVAPAQDSGDADAGNEADDPSRETDISEDNYRRFMELDDRRLERPAFPAAAMQPGSQLQKMGQLPESSQKHLRNQLRGIILARGDWTPEEIGRDYPFVPSAEARADSQLLRDEIEAWAELVTEYHEREAAVYAAGSGTPGAPAGNDPATAQQQAGGAPGSPGGDNRGGETGPDGQAGGEAGGEGQAGGDSGGGGAEGQGENADGGAEQMADEQPASRRPVAEPDSQDPAAPPARGMSTEGVEQSASEYLQARGFDTGPEPVERSPESPDNGPVATDAGRWGEASQTLPPPVREVTPAPPTLVDETISGESTAPAPNTLTLDELRGVRGVSESVEVGTSFDAMPAADSAAGDDEANGLEAAGPTGLQPDAESDPDLDPGSAPGTVEDADTDPDTGPGADPDNDPDNDPDGTR